MKKLMFLIIICLFVSANSFSFDLYDNTGTKNTYFNSSEPTLYVVADNMQNITIEFLSDSNITEVIYELSSCKTNKFCTEFSLLNLLEIYNTSFSSQKEFNIKQGTKEIKAYLDIKNPEVSITNYIIDKNKKILTIYINYSDNLKIKDIKIYNKLSSNNLVSLANLTNEKSWVYKITETKDLDLVLIAEDMAQNQKKIEEEIDMPDIFNPSITNFHITEKDSEYKVDFTVEDEFLSKYEFTQDTITMSEDISGKKYSKTIILPFTNNNVEFKVYDVEGNIAKKELSLKSPINYDFDMYYTSKKQFIFESNANKCTLLKIDDQEVEIDFDKNSDDFSTQINSITENREYKLYIRCSSDSYTDHFTTRFYYDTNPPIKPVISAEKTNQGSIIITWSTAVDPEGSNVKYYLYKNNQKIEFGEELKYVDTNVGYPNKYNYYVEITDESQNTIKSDILEITPKKTNLTFESSLEKEMTVKDENFTIFLNSETGVNVQIQVKNSGVIIDQNIINSMTQPRIQEIIKLEEGVNEVHIKADDGQGNIFEESYFITYQKPMENPGIELDVIQAPTNNSLTNNSGTNETAILQEKKVIEETASSNLIWFILIIMLFALFIWHFVINENKLKKNIKNKYSHYDKKRKEDHILGQSLRKAKIMRELKQKEYEEDKKKKINEKKLSDFDKQKLHDLKNRRNIIIPHEKKTPIREIINQRREMKKNSFETKLEKHTSEDTKKKHHHFQFIKKEQKVKKEDHMLSYLQRFTNNPSWNSTTSYKSKIEIVPNDEKIIEKKKNDNQDSLNKKINDFKQEKLKENNSKPLDSKVPQNKTLKDEMEEPLENHNPKKRNPEPKFDFKDYLHKRTKKRSSFFAEREVDHDLRSRKNNS